VSVVTQPQDLDVDTSELLARAGELEAVIPNLPMENPQVHPLGLASAVAACQQLNLSADRLRNCLLDGAQERSRLAESLRNAVKAYQDTDEAGGDAIDNGTSVQAPAVRGLSGDGPAARPTTAPTLLGSDGDYEDVEDRAKQIESGDGGAALLDFADQWDQHRVALQNAWDRFRRFQGWSGTACDAVEANFETQRTWMDSMSDWCSQLAKQARDLVAASRWIRTEHVWCGNDGQRKTFLDSAHFAAIDTDSGNLLAYLDGFPSANMGIIRFRWNSQADFQGAMANVQKTSDGVVAEFDTRAALPLAPIRPTEPPAAYVIPPPSDPSADPNPDPGGDDPSANSDVPDPNALDPANSAEFAGAESGFPSEAGLPSFGTPEVPSTDSKVSKELADALKKQGAPHIPVATGIKPASFGGAGAPVIPKLPLQPSLANAGPGPSVTPHSAASVPGLSAGPGRGMPGAAGAMGGGMGGVPMGGHGAGQGQAKAKRISGEDKSVYTENRAWTEGIIGRRRAKDKDTSTQ
jgi:hypothetical protein